MSDKVCLLYTIFNRAHLLKNSLERLTYCTIPNEILIIDDGSIDNCKYIVDSFKERLPINYIYHHNPTWGISSIPRNIGIKNTNCEIIITAEPEILFVTDVVNQMLEEHKLHNKDVINAGTVYHMGERAILSSGLINEPEIQLQKEKVSISNTSTVPLDLNDYSKVQGWVATFCALYRREWLINVNGWDQDFVLWGHEDTDLLTRVCNYNEVGERILPYIEVLHQWHDKLPPNIQYESVLKNEQLLKVKNINRLDNNNNLKANKNREWGIITPKP